VTGHIAEGEETVPQCEVAPQAVIEKGVSKSKRMVASFLAAILAPASSLRCVLENTRRALQLPVKERVLSLFTPALLIKATWAPIYILRCSLASRSKESVLLELTASLRSSLRCPRRAIADLLPLTVIT
jgi:hypothetical protein